MGTEFPTKVMLGLTPILMQMTFLNNVRKVGRLVFSRTSCLKKKNSGKKMNAYRIFVRKSLGNRILGRSRRRREVNIKMDLKEIGCENLR
jgi:hypothetical protein